MVEKPSVRIGGLLPLLLLTVACSVSGAGSTSATIELQVTTVPTVEATTTTDPDGSLDCPTTVSFIGIPEYPTDLIGEPTPRAAAERYAAFEGQQGVLIEIEALRFAIIEEGREVVIIEVSEVPAGGYLGGPIRGCA